MTLQVTRRTREYDVCVVGSGAAGGIAAKVLTEGGLEVVMLEAGPLLDIERDFKEHLWPYQLLDRGAGVGGSGYDAAGNPEMSVNHIGPHIPGEPYTSAPGSPFVWTRARILGGRTNHWTRVALRMAPADFKPRSADGAGYDWPIRYEDIAPYYAKVESYIGVYGTHESIPSAPNGVFQPVPKPRCSDVMIKRGCDKLRIPCIPGRAAILTRSLNGRPPCHYCNQCVRGCKVAATFSSSQVLIPPALATGRLKIIPQAMAREVIVGKGGKAVGVSYIDKQTRTEQQVRAKAVVLGASACESARLLLNSRSTFFPNGLANSSGIIGHYLMDTAASSVIGYFPQLSKLPPHDDEGTGSIHMYIPWWKYDRQNDFLRGYHVELYGGHTMPLVGMFDGVCHRFEGYGRELKQRCRDMYGCFAALEGRGETIPNEHSCCEIDPDVVDEWGIPVLRFHYVWSDNEIKMAKDMHETFVEIVEAAGGTSMKGGDWWSAGALSLSSATPVMQWKRARQASGYGYLSPGGVSHEVGTARMGTDPRISVLNGFCQAHDVKNLFVTDGACFATSPEKNPTLTILALSWRASEYLLNEAKTGSL